MKAINELLSIMKTLRDPDLGCPWDKKQTVDSIAPYTLEEVYEVLDSLENKDMDALCNELGDLLFHIVFYAEMASEQGDFNFNDVVERVTAKLKRRHPHVFADKQLKTTEELSISWEAIKRQERKEKAEQADVKMHILDDIGSNMPAVMRAEKLQLRAASVGFDWEDSEPVMAKIEEELLELKTELYGSAQAERLSEEMGDLLFSCINLARHIKVEPELALRQANRKFEQRFRFIEEQLSEQGLALQDASLEQMEAYWQAAKNKDI
jgi:nucleoside triphosphate diphosphatase